MMERQPRHHHRRRSMATATWSLLTLVHHETLLALSLSTPSALVFRSSPAPPCRSVRAGGAAAAVMLRRKRPWMLQQLQTTERGDDVDIAPLAYNATAVSGLLRNMSSAALADNATVSSVILRNSSRTANPAVVDKVNMPPSARNAPDLSSVASKNTEVASTRVDDVLPDFAWENATMAPPALGAWVPLASVSSLPGSSTPIEIQVLGHSLVVWSYANDNGTTTGWSVLDNVCSHRQVPLSLGTIEQGCLTCPLHGWSYAPNGTLVNIPALQLAGSSNVFDRAVPAYATHVHGDLLFVFLPTSMHGESFVQAVLPEHYYHLHDTNAYYYCARQVPAAFDVCMEQGLDALDLAPATAATTDTTNGNFTDLVIDSSSIDEKTTPLVRRHYQRPFLVTQMARHRVQRHAFIVPVRPGVTRILTSLLGPDARPYSEAPLWWQHMLQVQSQRDSDAIVQRLSAASSSRFNNNAAMVHASWSDLPVKAWRTWWRRFGMSHPVFGNNNVEAAPTVVAAAAATAAEGTILSVWERHTKHCGLCQTVLRRTLRLQKLSLVLLWASAMLARYRFLAAVATGVATLAMGGICTWIVNTLQGNSVPDGRL